jgi:hypothetical protein
MAKASRLGQKKCPNCNAWIKGTRTKACPKCDHPFNKNSEPLPVPAPINAIADKPTKAGDAITIAQVRAVAQMVALVGGFDRCHELLGVIRDVGGLRRMKDLLDAMAAAQVVQPTV